MTSYMLVSKLVLHKGRIVFVYTFKSYKLNKYASMTLIIMNIIIKFIKYYNKKIFKITVFVNYFFINRSCYYVFIYIIYNNKFNIYKIRQWQHSL